MKKYNSDIKQNILVCLFFGIIAISFLAPLASNQFMPGNDTRIHVGVINLAHKAMSAGQFPILHITRFIHGLQLYQYPIYQFYSNLPYTFSGALVYITHNPLLAYKLALWFAFTLAGIYIYRVVNWLMRSRPAALLAGVVYMAAPYFITNVVWRGDFTEAFAQGILPIVLYYTLRLYRDPFNIRTFCLTTLAWFALAAAHLITFACSSLFIGLLILLLQIKDYRNHTWKKFIYTGVAYIYGLILALWFLAPIIFTEKYLIINRSLNITLRYLWLTALPSLFSITAIPPLYLGQDMSISFSVGWIILLAVGIAIYMLCMEKNNTERVLSAYTHKKNKNTTLIKILLVLFFLVFLLIWSPFPFWGHLPKYLTFFQFSYRLLSQIMWIGALLFAYAIILLFKGNLDKRHVIVGLVLICLIDSSWLSFWSLFHNDKTAVINVTNVKNSPTVLLPNDYSVDPNKESIFPSQKPLLPTKYPLSYAYQLPLVYTDGWLMLNKTINLPYAMLSQNPDLKLQFEGSVPAYIGKKAITLSIQSNNHFIRKKLKAGHFKWEIPLNQLKNINKQKVRLSFLSDATLPKTMDKRNLAVFVKTLRLTNFSPNFILPVTKCNQIGAETICQITSQKNGYAFLPIYYYPNLLDVEINGQRADYYPIISFAPSLENNDANVVLTAIKLKTGNNDIKVRFCGLSWANRISVIAWLCLLLTLITNFLAEIYKYYAKPKKIK